MKDGPLRSFDFGRRFKRLDFLTSKKKLVDERPPTPERSETEERDEMLRHLARQDECRKGLIPMLNERIEQLDLQMRDALHSHPDLCALQGAKDEVRSLKQKLMEFQEEQ